MLYLLKKSIKFRFRIYYNIIFVYYFDFINNNIMFEFYVLKANNLNFIKIFIDLYNIIYNYRNKLSYK